MRRTSSTWLFSIAALLVVSTAAVGETHRPSLCLPHLFEEGMRLNDTAGIWVYWLELLLRQHEVCWRAPQQPDELRVFLYGNSAVFGYSLRPQDSFAYGLNERFDRRRIPAHIFNLGFAMTYQLKDALIMRASLTYQPDVIVYGVTLSDFEHVAPSPFFGIMQFFDVNRALALQFAAERPAGLEEPLEIYRSLLSMVSLEHSPAQQLWQLGAAIRAAAREHARRIPGKTSPDLPDDPEWTARRRTLRYDCGRIKEGIEQRFKDWQQWNILAYLKQLSDSTGVPVAIINWPVANEPVDDCYNVRYTNAALAEYNQWLAEQAHAAGFAYIDLHDFLSPEDFVDSLHVAPRGHRKLAERLAPFLDTWLSHIASDRRTSPQTATDIPSRVSDGVQR